MTTCARCRRHLLAGERYRLWRATEDAGPRAVCGPCEGAARGDGWIRAADPGRAARDEALGRAVKLVA